MPDQQQSTAPPGCQPVNSTPYGTGNMSFGTTVPLSRDTVRISASGNYIPSSKFLSDTVSEQGVGGFVKDTTIASKPLRGQISAFLHFPTGSVPYQRILAFQMYNPTGSGLGSFFVVRPNETKPYAYAYGTYYVTDDTIYISKNGVLNVSGVDTCARTMHGTFSGVFMNVADTTDQLRILGGDFNVTYVDKVYAY
jgi:hypothetical protein